ncbi:MAG: multicopper oxidase family protein [Rubrobacteraceae bacterium]
MSDFRELKQPANLSRRKFLGIAGMSAGALALSGCGILPGSRESLPKTPQTTKSGKVSEYSFDTASMDFDLGGRTVQTWSYNDTVPGPEIRFTEGDTLRVKVNNRLPAETTIHWHGLPIVNDMDGVPDVTQPPIASGEQFVYEFVVPVAGSYMYHSHVGLQLDRGLYGPLIVDPKKEDLDYDREYTLMLDDWLDGVSGTPEDAFSQLKSSGGGMGGGMMGGGDMGGGEAGSSGDIEYPLYLVNGRVADDPETFEVRRGERVRLRLMNPAADTVFRFAVAGHKLTVTHADGQPVEPVEVDTVSIGMGERYDVILKADNPGVWQMAAAPEGKSGIARTVLRYAENGESSAPTADARPKELDGKLLVYGDLRTTKDNSFPEDSLFGGPDRKLDLTLSGGMGDYVWAIDGQVYPDADPLEIREGEWVRFNLQNRSMMDHPMHLHGHFFQVRNGTGRGPFKDTVIVDSHGNLSIDFVADNPGDWMFHCHNLYHLEAGMARVVSYAG